MSWGLCYRWDPYVELVCVMGPLSQVGPLCRVSVCHEAFFTGGTVV